MADGIRRIAVEEAFAFPAQLEELARLAEANTEYHPDLALAKRQTAGGAMTASLLDLEGDRLRLMDEARVDMALLLLTAPGLQLFEPGLGASMAKEINDMLAALVVRHPTRFAALAAVAPQAPAEAAREIERAMTKLGHRGIVINSHTDGEYLDEEKYWPILEAAEAFGAPIYIHPRAFTPAIAQAYRRNGLEHAIWGFQAETGLHGLRLITSGIFDRFPKLRIVLGHAGEGLPFWIDRVDYMHAKPRGRPELKQKPSHYLRENFYCTTSGMNWHRSVRFLVDAMGADRVMFAADYPYQHMHEEVALMNTAPLTDEELRKVYSGTAQAVFGL
jgi:5-carboxyvanillate decarboxylase